MYKKLTSDKSLSLELYDFFDFVVLVYLNISFILFQIFCFLDYPTSLSLSSFSPSLFHFLCSKFDFCFLVVFESLFTLVSAMAGRYDPNPFDEEEVNPFSVSLSSVFFVLCPIWCSLGSVYECFVGFRSD